MNELPSIRAITARTIKTTRPFFISTSTPSDSRLGVLYATPFPFGKVLIQRAGDLLQFFQIRTVHGNYFTVKFSRFAKFQKGIESQRIRTREGRRASNHIALGHRRLLAEGDYGVAQERQHAGKGLSQDGDKLFRIP